MNRYIAKVNREHCPRGIVRPVTPADWNGGFLSIPKTTPRRVETTNRAGLPQIAPGDELWICTDVSGPGIVAFGSVASVTSEPTGLAVSLGEVTSLQRPVALGDFPRKGSGSRLISRLQVNRPPELYFVDDELFAEFGRVVESRFGPGALPTTLDWPGVIERNRAEIRKAAELERQVPLSLRPIREGQRAFRDRLLRLYDGQCVVSGCSIPSAVEAAHIVPWTGDPELDREENGLILRRDLHGLFDAGLFAISPKTGSIEIASALLGSEYEDLDGEVVRHRAAVELIAVKYELFREAWPSR